MKRRRKGEANRDPFPEPSVVEERIRERLADVHPLASEQLEHLSRSLPAGVDHQASAFFLMASRSLGLDVRGLLPYACSLEALSMAFRALLSLSAFRSDRVPRGPERRREEGMNLLLSDGLILLAFRFLTELEPGTFRRLAPLLVRWARDRTGSLREMPDTGEGLLDIQRSLSRLALESLRSLSGNERSRMAGVEELVEQVNIRLSIYRKARTAQARRVVLEELKALSGSLSLGGEQKEPLSHYVSLILMTLDPTS